MSDAFWLFVVIFLIIGVGSAAWAGVRAAPWLPTRRDDIRRLFDLAELKPGETVYDLGCGDGRVLLVAAEEYGARAVGFEISIVPYLAALVRRAMNPFRKNITVRFEDFYRTSLKEADLVYCFLTPSAMQRLKTKFVRELRPGARVVSYTFSLGDLPGVIRDKPTPKLPTAYLFRTDHPPISR